MSRNSSNSQDARDFQTFLANSLDCLLDRLDCNRHVEGIGMDERRYIAHDRDMALPEYEIATFGIAQVAFTFRTQTALLRITPLQVAFLHVGVAPAWDAAGRQRNLHQARTVNSKTGLSAPEIRNFEEPFRHSHEVAFVEIKRRKMARRHEAACRRHGKRTFKARNGNSRPERERLNGRQFDRWPWEYQRARHRNLMGRCDAGARQGIGGQPSHVAV